MTETNTVFYKPAWYSVIIKISGQKAKEHTHTVILDSVLGKVTSKLNFKDEEGKSFCDKA